MLAALEAIAHEAGIRRIRLETGVSCHAALGLYELAGFRPIGPFADYQPDPLSIFLEKELNATSGASPDIF